MNRRLPLILVAGALVLCLVGVILAGISAGSGFGAVAYTVGDTKVSQQSVNDDLKARADNPAFTKSVFGATFQTTPGAVDSTSAAGWLTLEIRREVASRGRSVTAAQRQQALDTATSQAGEAFAKALGRLPAGLQRRLLDLIAVQSRLKAQLFKGVHITVDPKYGFWSPKNFAVCPPTGCPAQTGATGTSG
jgi:hypothetical protein